MPSKNHNDIEEVAISEILQVIEKYGMSAFEAEQIPDKLKSSIKLQNILLMDEIRFKIAESQEK